MLDSLSMTTRLWIGAALIGALFLATFAALNPGGPAHAQVPLEVTFQSPKEGDVLGEPPFAIQMCFSRPINIKDLEAGGDFRFNLTDTAGFGLGLRIVFQPDGWGYSIYPGPPASGISASPIRDHWLFEWHVVAADDGAPSDGQITFKVDPSAEPIPSETPPVCLPGGNTATPVPTFGESATPTEAPETETPEASEEPSPEATEEPGGEDSEDGDDRDIGPLAFATIGIAAALAVVGLVMYFVRKRAGFDPHAPTEESDTGGDDGHH